MNYPTRFLLWVAGESEPGALSSRERLHAAALGGLVLIPAVFACLGATWGLRLHGVPLTLAGPAALLWGAVVLQIDRYLVMTFPIPIPERGFSWNRATHWARTLAHVSSRIFLAVMLGLLIGHLAALAVLDDAIEEELASRLEVKRAALEQQHQAHVSPLLEEAKQLQQQLSAAQERRATVDLTAAAELAGSRDWAGTSGQYGDGRAYHRWERALSRATVDLETLRAEVTQRLAAVDAQRNAADQRHSESLARVSASQARGVLGRSRVLFELAATDRHVAVIAGFFLLLLTTVDSLPVVLKLITRPGPTAKRVAVEEWMAEEALLVDLEAVRELRDSRTRLRRAAWTRRVVKEAQRFDPRRSQAWSGNQAPREEAPA